MNRFLIVLMAGLVGFGSFMSGEAWAQNQVLLGERHVSDRSERDTINVGMKRGKFTGFRVKAEGAPIEFKQITIHFENGSKQVFEKNRILGRGDKSRKIDFDGGARYVDRVVFFYEARTIGWKGADVKLFGVR